MEPFSSPSAVPTFGASKSITNDTLIAVSGNVKYYTHNLDVWLPPGSVDYLYHNGSISNAGTYVSDYTRPTKHISIYLASGDMNVLVVPGYVVDGFVYDGLDLAYPDNAAVGTVTNPTYNKFRVDNYSQPFMWPDDTTSSDTSLNTYLHNNGGSFVSASLQRDLMFRNYVNLLTGYYVFRPDEPNGSGLERLITEFPSGAPRPRYGLGAYYPSAGFYWPFGGETDSKGYVTNAVGVDYDSTFALSNPTVDNGSPFSRHIAYSINMLSTNAAPEWYGELFYNSSSGAGTNVMSGNSTTSASEIMQSDDWKVGAPAFMGPFFSSGIMTNEPTHNTNIAGNPSVWRPAAFNGSQSSPVDITV